MRIDLHVHSSASDGLLSPTALVAEAAQAGVRTLALTDHDTVAGIEEALAAGARFGVEVIPGIEMTAFCAGVELHILGLFVDHRHHALKEFLNGARRARVERMEQMIARLRGLGVEIGLEEVRAKAAGGSLGRPHLARALVDRGVVGSVGEAFDAYLAAGRAAYVERPDVKSAQAIGVIRAAGGVPVLAHPTRYGRDDLIPQLVREGLRGLEACHADHDPGAVAHYLRLAGDHGLAVSGGSDFHGPASGRSGQLGAPWLRPEHVEALRALHRQLSLVGPSGRCG